MKLYSNGLDVDPMVIVEVPLVESIFSTCSLVILSLKRISPFTVTLSGEEEAISNGAVCSVKLLSCTRKEKSKTFNLLSTSTKSPSWNEP